MADGNRQAAAGMMRREPDQPTSTLGVTCFAGDLGGAARLVVARACSTRGGYACLANAHVIVSAHHQPELRRALDGAWQVFPDGAPVAWLQRRLGCRDARRVGGPDLMPRVCEYGVPLNLRHFLLGSTDDVLVRLRLSLEHSHPGIVVAGSYSPSRIEINEGIQPLIERIRPSSPHIVWCAFGAPRQEIWMAGATSELPDSLLVGVGAAFDFIAGTKQRAHPSIQRAGLEWTHRLAMEPRRLVGRYLRTNFEFVVRAASQLAKSEKR